MSLTPTEITEKRTRGRPRKYPKPDPNIPKVLKKRGPKPKPKEPVVKRPRGRPRKVKVEPERPKRKYVKKADKPPKVKLYRTLKGNWSDPTYKKEYQRLLMRQRRIRIHRKPDHVHTGTYIGELSKHFC